MSVPFLTQSRISPIRRLSNDECERLEFAGPLLLARRERRFIIGPWRRGRELLVVRPTSSATDPEVVMVTDVAGLRARSVEP
jgi:hypothetical protein